MPIKEYRLGSLTSLKDDVSFTFNEGEAVGTLTADATSNLAGCRPVVPHQQEPH